MSIERVLIGELVREENKLATARKLMNRKKVKMEVKRLKVEAMKRLLAKMGAAK